MKIRYPLKRDYPITGTYGPRESFQLPNGQWTLPYHYGVDWGAPTGTPVYAAHDGVVRHAGWDHSAYGGGNMVGIVSGDWSTWYLHLDTINVRVGQHVKTGQQIGTVGSTGASTGAHLHFEQQYRWNTVNPLNNLHTGGDGNSPPYKPMPPFNHPEISEEEDDEMKLWIAVVMGHWRLIVPTGSGKPNAVSLPGDSGMASGGAARAGIPVVRLRSDADLRKVANL